MDHVSLKKRSWIMSRVKSSGNRSTELELITLLRKNGIKGWRRRYPLIGSPDFVFPKSKVAVFVDGYFWHGHPQKCRIPNTNKSYWEQKIARNVTRDRLVTRALREKGWAVIRIWEDAINKPATLTKLRKALT